MPKYYNICFRMDHPKFKKPRWPRIGRATEIEEGKIACTIESIPLNWNGEFYLFPSEPKIKEEPT